MDYENRRLEIRELYENDSTNYEFSRFILALHNLINSDDWFRIAGIHGSIFLKDDVDILCPRDPIVIAQLMKNDEPTYCCHNDDRFLIWHRVYLYEFELLLRKYDVYKNKQNLIMLPYLNWLVIDKKLFFVNEENITVYLENGEATTIHNPLYSGRLYDEDDNGDYINNTNNTNKYTVRNGKLLKDYDCNRTKSERKDIIKALNFPNYELVSSNFMTDKKRDYTNFLIGKNSLEVVHNHIHVKIGGLFGTMTNVLAAPFDPIFWLHHCFIEKLFYAWQVKITDNNSKLINSTQDYDNNMILPETLEQTLPPFFNRGTDKFCWRNNTNNFTTVREWFDYRTIPYSYDVEDLLILSKPVNKDIDYKDNYLRTFGLDDLFDEEDYKIILEDAPVPQNPCVISLYLFNNSDEHINDEFYDKKYRAARYYWFGLNRKKVECIRCNQSTINMIFDITEWIKNNDINPDKIQNYIIKLKSDDSNITHQDCIIGLGKFTYITE
jgi:hypothetical protein